MLLRWDGEKTSTAVFFLELLDGRSLFLDTLDHSIGHHRWPINIVSLLGLRNVDSVQDGLLLLGVLCLLGQSVVQQDVTSLAFHVSDAVARHV